MSSNDLDPQLEAALETWIRDSREVFHAMVTASAIRYKNAIAIDLSWPDRLMNCALGEQLSRQIKVAHQFPAPSIGVGLTRRAALDAYLSDFHAANDLMLGGFSPHGAALFENRSRRKVIFKMVRALVAESDLTVSRVEIPGIDLKLAAVFIRYGCANKIAGPRIVYWLQQEIPWHEIVTEVRDGGVSPDSPAANDEGPELGGHGPRIAGVVQHAIDSDFGLELDRVADWLENGRWPLASTQGQIFTAMSEWRARPDRQWPLIKLFWLFGFTHEIRTWLQEFAEFQEFNLRNFADDVIMRGSESEESHAQPPRAPAAAPPGPRLELLPKGVEGAAVATKQSDAQAPRSNIAAIFTDTRSRFIGEIIVSHPGLTAKQICAEADRRRQLRDKERKALAPLESWIRTSGEQRPENEWMRHDDLWSKVYENEESRHSVEGWISKRKSVLSSPKKAS